jgi:cytochrome c peroxidase
MSENIKITLMVISGTAIILLSTLAFADGNVKRGKALFNDPNLSGSSFGVSCNTCHPGGKGLEKSGADEKKKWNSCAGEQKCLEDAINTCILTANKGRSLAVESQEMKDLIAYIKSLTKRNLPKAH